MTNKDKFNHAESYGHHVENLRSQHADEQTVMQQAIGGEFEAIGMMERDLLISQGLPSDGFVIDVGCGSGRLAIPLSHFLTGRYLGIDVVPELLAYAAATVARPDWRFEDASGLVIPADDQSADIVCFFSVFTHLLHEESYAYLTESRRVLKPTGKIIFSFLEFAIPNHWAVFESTVAAIGTGLHHNQFMSRDGILSWAQHLDMQVQFWDGHTPHIPLRQPVTLESGERFDELGALGQSVAVMSFA